MIKRIITVAASGALLLGLATPALASFGGHYFNMGGNTTNNAVVENYSSATSNTGYNTQFGSKNTLFTGDAWSESNSEVVVNSNESDCGCDNGNVTNNAFVMNGSEAMSNTGMNEQHSFGNMMERHHSYNQGGSNFAATGDAFSSANSWSFVNTNVSH